MLTKGRQAGPQVAWAGKARLVALALPLLFALLFGASQAGAQTEARAAMQQVFTALVTLLPMTANDEGFSDPADREKIEAAIEQLARATQDLEAHGEGRDADFLDLSQSLADDATDIRLAFELDHLEFARFQTQWLTQRCIDCHARLPDDVDAQIGERWIDDAGLADLPAPDRARLLVATRRFDDALTTWESVFQDKTILPFEIDLRGWGAEYLMVALRVKRDPARAEPVVRALANRPDTPRSVQGRLLAWADALEYLRKTPPSGHPFEDAKRLAARGHANLELLTGRGGLVYDLAASGLLLAWLDDVGRPGTPSAPGAMRAEAWYMLGLLDDRIAFAWWTPRTGVFMEAVLRADPGGPLADRAYERAEEILLRDYGVASPEELPRGPRQTLEELEELRIAPQPRASVD
jgi:hypothetical protein